MARVKAPRRQAPRLGQHHLFDPRILSRIAGACKVEPSDWIIEIGGGSGSLSRHLAERCGKLLVIEKDPSLAIKLRERFALTNVEVVEDDFRSVDLGLLAERAGANRGVLCGNIPYYLSTQIVERFIEAKARFLRAILLTQEEFATRCCAWAGGRDYGSFSIFVQQFCHAKRLFKVPSGAFRPPPKVESLLLELVLREEDLVKVDDLEWYFYVVRTAFGVRRKKVLNALSEGMGLRKSKVLETLDAAGLNSAARAEEWSPFDFAKAAAALKELDSGSANNTRDD